MNRHVLNLVSTLVSLAFLSAASLNALDKAPVIPGYPEAGIQSLSDYQCLELQEIPKNINYNICVQQQSVSPSDMAKSNEFSIITQGVSKLFQIIQTEEFEACSKDILKNAPDLDRGMRQLREAIRFKETASGTYFPRYVLVHIISPRENFKFTQYSYGYPNYYFSPAHDSTTNRWARHLSIAVHSHFLANDDFAFGHDPHFWAAVTLPAFLSNLGRTDRPFSKDSEENSSLMKCVLEASKEGIR